MFCHIINMCKVFLLTGGLICLMTSCEIEYIPAGHGEGHTSVSGKEGNFHLAFHFAKFGEDEAHPFTHSMEAETSKRNMEPETDVIRVDDNLFIHATLAADPADRAPDIMSRKFQVSAKIRVVVFRENPASVYTKVFETLYAVNSNGTLKREDSNDMIILPAGSYKLVAYSYNNPNNPPPAYSPSITAIDPSNDLIWGESQTVTVVDGTISNVPITMVHKLSQVRLAATTGHNGSTIAALSGVTMPGYTVDLTTFDGTLTKNTAIDQSFNFSTLNIDTVKSNTRTVYTAGDMPTIVNIGSMTVGTKTVNNITATFAKSLQSGYTYTIKMRVGNPADLTDDLPPEGFTPYVGAFWKANQTGERLIRMPRASSGKADGVWTATVVAGIDWIVLDTLMTTDPNVGWRTGASEQAVKNGNDPNFDTNYPVGGARKHVGGILRPANDPNYKPNDENIYFRIGLKSQYTPTPGAPARYGVVLLTYANNSKRQRIWIRQGEGADYLMRTTDLSASPDFISADRPVARQFSPYNLTTSGAFNAAVSINGAKGQSDPPAKFTEYPTQAGAFFQWANSSNKRYAYAPYGTGVGYWDPVSNATGYWTDATYYLADTYESCPEGYRRPTDGSTDSAVGTTTLSPDNMKLSEMRQSLYANPVAADNAFTAVSNSVYGYYADGFFDRRAIVNSDNGVINSAVSAGNNSIAYQGRLFFNPKPDSYASVFFPAAGYRLSNSLTGTLTFAGSNGYYWSSSSPNSIEAGGGGKSIELYATAINQNNYDRRFGFSIRCVVDVPLPIPGTITVSPDNVLLPYTEQSPATQTVTVTTLKGNGQPDPTAQWTLTSADASWLKLSLSPSSSFSSATPSVSGTGSQTVYLYALNNVSINSRTTTIYKGASSSDVVVTVTQWGNTNSSTITDNEGAGTPPANVNSYVGAFWRADQTGERVIRIDMSGSAANYGDWTAQVMWLDARWGAEDGVALSTDKLPGTPGADPNIYTASPGNPENYQVDGYSMIVTGNANAANKYVIFRIGLKTKFTAYNKDTNPARYGVLLFSYANNTKFQKIFLRQGEGADYLMTNNDAISSGNLTKRTQCVKFSPFNLTAATLNAQTGINGADPNPGIFTDYPTQSGALFQWSNSNNATNGTSRMRWAWDPHTTASNPGGWQNWNGFNFWSDALATQETCPAGYRRPNDGSITAYVNGSDISKSEMRQSLMWKPLTGVNYASTIANTLKGYYADGFFDRRPLVNGLGTGAINTTVALTTRDVAHIGRLYFNPTAGSDHCNASIFFPFAGVRDATITGQLGRNGTDGWYWTSSASDPSAALFLRFQNADQAASIWILEKDHGISIRCVKAP